MFAEMPLFARHRQGKMPEYILDAYMLEKNKISDLRREFDAAPVVAEMLSENPHQVFETWFLRVIETKIEDPTACVLATVDDQGRPDTRVVLLKDFSNNTFTFYTNFYSQKAIQMQACPWVALNFYWPSLFRQVRIRGHVNKIDPEKSATYFHSRPRDSQISAYASHQSAVTTQAALEAAFFEQQQRFSEQAIIPYPSFWGGYCITPNEFEFWQGQKHRMHDRIRYVLQNESWIKQVLAP